LRFEKNYIGCRKYDRYNLFNFNSLGFVRTMIVLEKDKIIYHNCSDILLKPMQDITFDIVFDEESTFYVCQYYSLNVYVYAKKEKDLLEELKADLLFLWKQYALEEDNKLTKSAIKVKENLKSHFKQV